MCAGVEGGMILAEGAQEVCGEPSIARTGFDEIEAIGIRNPQSAVRNLNGEQLAEHGPDVDARKKIARAAGTLSGAGVITKLGMVEREVHERGHRERAASTHYISNLQSAVRSLRSALDQSFLTVTKISPSPRQTRICAMRPDGTFASSRAASAAFDTGLRFTARITSPPRS